MTFQVLIFSSGRLEWNLSRCYLHQSSFLNRLFNISFVKVNSTKLAKLWDLHCKLKDSFSFPSFNNKSCSVGLKILLDLWHRQKKTWRKRCSKQDLKIGQLYVVCRMTTFSTFIAHFRDQKENRNAGISSMKRQQREGHILRWLW